MYHFQYPKIGLTGAQLCALADRFETLDSPVALARLLGQTEDALQQLAEKPAYHQFYVPKPGGEKRFIQHPSPPLKTVQAALNRYLQAVYYRIRPACAHGFLVSPADEAQPRSIYTNALAHTRGHWFLNIDIKDFFHAITERHLMNLFENLFWYPRPLARLLTGLCCCNGRLPMGAPTSPALANLAFYFPDYRLDVLARDHEATYTRYADDLTFSFARPPADGFLENIRMELLKEGFILNEKKVRLQGRLETPEITGLCVGNGNRPTLSGSFLKTLKREINIYHWMVAETVQKRGIFPAWFFDQFRKSLAGQVEFVGFVLGKGDRMYRKLHGKMQLWDLAAE